MEQIVTQIETHWTVILALGSAVFFLYKIRAEETLRTKLKLIYECYNSFALLNDAAQDWAHPSSGDMAVFAEALKKLMPDAQRNFHQASVLMRPETVRSLNKVFILLSQLHAQYSIWQMYKKNEGYPNELVKAFDNARKNLPMEIQKTVHDLLTDFQLQVNGVFKMIWWKVTGKCYPCFRDKMNHGLAKSFEEDRQALIKSLK